MAEIVKLPTKKASLEFKKVMVEKIGRLNWKDPHAVYLERVVPDAHKMQLGDFTRFLFAARKEHVYGGCPDYMAPTDVRDSLATAFAKILIAEGVNETEVLAKMKRMYNQGGKG